MYGDAYRCFETYRDPIKLDQGDPEPEPGASLDSLAIAKYWDGETLNTCLKLLLNA